MLVPGALLGAGAADFGAFFQQVRGMFRVAGHEAGRERARIGAVAGEANATGIICTSGSCRQAVLQYSQAVMQALRASSWL